MQCDINVFHGQVIGNINKTEKDEANKFALNKVNITNGRHYPDRHIQLGEPKKKTKLNFSLSKWKCNAAETKFRIFSNFRFKYSFNLQYD